MFIILLAALANVDHEQLDAAAIDGASRWQAFCNVIILPAIRPVMMIAILIRGIDLIRVFDVVWQLTRGGPGSATETVSIYAYIRGFQEFDTSYIAAVVVLLTILFSVDPRRRAEADGDRAMRHAAGGGRWRQAGWYAASTAIAGRLPVSGLLDVRRVAEDAARDLQVSAGLVPGRRRSSTISGFSSATAMSGRSGTASSSPRPAP